MRQDDNERMITFDAIYQDMLGKSCISSHRKWLGDTQSPFLVLIPPPMASPPVHKMANRIRIVNMTYLKNIILEQCGGEEYMTI